MQKKLAFIFGTRPEYIKIAPIVNLFKSDKNFDVRLIFTNQHKTMVDEFFPIFNIYPDIRLDVDNQGNLSNLTASIIQKLDALFKEENFDIAFVHGDTTSTFCGGLVGFYNNVKIAHIEAGLRSFDINSPFPEEMNRKFIGSISTYHFCATKNSMQNILNEGIKENVYVVGNTSIDAIKWVLKSNFKPSDNIQKLFQHDKSKYALLTVHRRENFSRLEEIFLNISKALNNNKNLKLILPMHLNPVPRNMALKYFKNNPQVVLTEPLNYIDIAFVMSKSNFIMTDSGGLQEEGTYFKIPILVLRDSTERPEGVELGFAKLLKNYDNLSSEIADILSGKFKISSDAMPYGNGRASEAIHDAICKLF